jgi:hypothetical protein
MREMDIVVKLKTMYFNLISKLKHAIAMLRVKRNRFYKRKRQMHRS